MTSVTAPRRLIEYIKKHPNEELTCEALEDLFGLAPRTVKQYMQNLINRGELDYLEVIRPSEAWINNAPKVKVKAQPEQSRDVNPEELEALIQNAVGRIVQLFQSRPGRIFYLDDLLRELKLSADLLSRALMVIEANDLLPNLHITGGPNGRVWQYIQRASGDNYHMFEVMGRTSDGSLILKELNQDSPGYDIFYRAYEL
jgi:hypothetical protein